MATRRSQAEMDASEVFVSSEDSRIRGFFLETLSSFYVPFEGCYRVGTKKGPLVYSMKCLPKRGARLRR